MWYVCSGTLSQEPFSLVAVLFFSVHRVTIVLICTCLYPPVYSMGRSLGCLERLCHLFLPGRRRPVQGEPFKVSVFCQHASLSQVRWFLFMLWWMFFFTRVGWLQAGGGENEWFPGFLRPRHKHDGTNWDILKNEWFRGDFVFFLSLAIDNYICHLIVYNHFHDGYKQYVNLVMVVFIGSKLKKG